MAKSYSLHAFLILLEFAQAAPSRNLTLLNTQFASSFVPEPDGRGTWGLLYSCLFTLALCVWTAFHPNVKTPEASSTGKYWIKTKWVVLAIFAPEIGVLTAFKQYRQAKSLASELSDLEIKWEEQKSSNPDVLTTDGGSSHSGDAEESKEANTGSISSPRPFSKTYGFYILMGGLTVDVSHIHDQSDRLLITPSGLIHLAKKGYFFHISDADIEDKSKANILAKGLVLLQITWTVFQCITRKATGLPLSVLEVHILVHAGCALIMYVLWFNKPMDVDEPFDVSSQIPDKIVALMLIRSHRFGAQPYGNLEVPIEYTPVQLKGTKRVWPDRSMSEAAYLMYDRDHNKPSIGAGNQDGTLQPPAIAPNSGIESTPIQPGSIRGNSLSSNTQRDHTNESRRAQGEARQQQTHNELSRHKLLASDPKRIKQLGNMRKQRRSRLETMISPPRRGAIYTSKPPTSTSPTAADPDQHICLGYRSSPAPSIPTVATIGTGQFLRNGIGPRAFVTGHWRGDRVAKRNPPFKPPTSIIQVPPDLCARLPLDKVDRTTIVYYCPLQISLSRNDVRRWELAGAALGEELDAQQSIQPASTHDNDNGNNNTNAFLSFENEADTISGSYLVASSLLTNGPGSCFEELFHSVWGSPTGTNRHVSVLFMIHRHLLQFEEFDLGAATAVMMLPGLLYGILHSTLWSYEFPTSIERVLWRISSVTLISVPVVAGTMLLGRAAWGKVFCESGAGGRDDGSAGSIDLEKAGQEDTDIGNLPPCNSNISTSPAAATANEDEDASLTFKQLVMLDVVSVQRMLLNAVMITLCATTALYIFSRVFIIVESFISLRYVPVGVYAEVGWSKYVPHL
ncbi:MAG: hypothetical protein Q9169_007990 [Polycauliona sp. 2 TL-2023]